MTRHVSSPASPKTLQHIARLCGIAPGFYDEKGNVVRASSETLVKLINALAGLRLPLNPGANVLEKALFNLRRKRRREQPMVPVIPAWNGALSFWIWLADANAALTATLTNEKGNAIPLRIRKMAVLKRGGETRAKFSAPRSLPFGYYRLRLMLKEKVIASSFIIAAPERVAPRRRNWGLFAPFYALRRTPADIGGDYTALAAAARFVGAAGGSFLGTLPLGPLFYEGKYRDASPYAPVSRLFLNEMLLDVARLPGVPALGAADKAEARALARQMPRDEAAVYAFRKKVLQRAARQFFGSGGHKKPGFQKLMADTPYLEAYAADRAGGDKAQYRYHLYAQYACARQIAIFRGARKGFADLYVDYPVGVHHAGFDARHFSHLFLKGFSVGAPPDRFAAAGQNWGFPPLHPKRLVEDEFAYLRAALRHSLKIAPMLRLDHMMGFFRIFCVAEGAPTSEGAYILYPSAAIMAVLCLEAHRHKAVLIGEDLGIVPQRVRDSMTRHGIDRIWVGQFEMTGQIDRTFRSIIPGMIAGANTHDLFPFAAHMAGSDIGLLQSLGLLSRQRAARLTAERKKHLRFWRREKQPLARFLKGLAASKAQHVIVNAEDLWGESLPQNIPGMSRYKNWQKPFRYAVSEWKAQPEIARTLKILNRYRGKK